MISWLVKTIRLRGFSPAKWKDDHDATAAQFLTSAEARKLVAFIAADGELCLIAAHSSFPVAPRQFCFWVRRDSSALSPATIKAGVQFGMVNGGGVDSLLRVMGDVFAPQVTGGVASAAWPDSVRKDFVSQLQRCMASLVEASHVAKGKTVLYLPPEEGLGASDAEAAALLGDKPQLGRLALDKDLIQRLEACVIHWTHQIKEVVSNQDNTSGTAESGGPLDEIAFWASRTQDLSGISAQLSQPRLLAIVGVLREAKSSYLAPFDTLAKSIQSGSELVSSVPPPPPSEAPLVSPPSPRPPGQRQPALPRHPQANVRGARQGACARDCRPPPRPPLAHPRHRVRVALLLDGRAPRGPPAQGLQRGHPALHGGRRRCAGV